MVETRDLFEIALEFMFASPLDDARRKQLFKFFDQIASSPSTQVWIETSKEFCVGKVPEKLFLKNVTKGIEEKEGWLRIEKPMTTQYLYSDIFAYLVTVVTSNISGVSAKLHEYCYGVLQNKGGKVILKKNRKETILLPYEGMLSQEELTRMLMEEAQI